MQILFNDGLVDVQQLKLGEVVQHKDTQQYGHIKGFADGVCFTDKSIHLKVEFGDSIGLYDSKLLNYASMME